MAFSRDTELIRYGDELSFDEVFTASIIRALGDHAGAGQPHIARLTWHMVRNQDANFFQSA